MSKPGRNDPCPCGSGKKYKQCCERRAAATESASPGAHAASLQAALAHHRAGRLPQAEALYRQILQAEPDHPDALHYLGTIASATGRQRDAAELIEEAIRIRPSRAMHYNLGNALKAMGDTDGAERSYRAALALDPGYAEAHVNLGNSLQAQGKLEDAVGHYRRALQLKPDLADAHVNLGNALNELGKLDEAVSCFQKALALKPGFTQALSGLLYLYAFTRLVPPEQECDLAANWEHIALSESERAIAHQRFPGQPDLPPRAGRKLKVGIVSAELGQHAVAEFLEPLLEQIDRNRFHVTLYPTAARTEPRAARFRELADTYTSLVGVPDKEAGDLIRSDSIDVLVDTTGHMKGCRLGIFARRSAPVQCHYIGYHGTTGLTEMDWFIADDVLLPPACDVHFREGIWRLPRLWIAYRGDTSLPASNWRPNPGGTIWLGSFNNLTKVTGETLALWAKVMNALPESRLLLKDIKTADPGVRQRIAAELFRHGIAGGRVEFAAWVSGWPQHMALYDRLDIALDAIPLNSGTTAFDALWMGVPLVALEGNWMGGRMTCSMLTALGKPEWIAKNEAEYVAIVAALARDVEKRKSLRASQRALVAGSPLCDAQGLAKALEDAFEAMFDRWTEKQNVRTPSTARRNVVFVGDSITRGTYNSARETYTSFADRALSGLPEAYPAYTWHVYNEGVNSSCTRDWVQWADSKVIAHRPTDVVICLGINDAADDSFTYHVPLAEFQNNLQAIISKIRAHNRSTRIILINIPLIHPAKQTLGRTDPYRTQYRKIICSVAEATGCGMVDAFAKMEQLSGQADFDPYYFSDDGIHLSDASHVLIHQKLLPLFGSGS